MRVCVYLPFLVNIRHVLLGLALGTAQAQTPAEVEVLRWKDGKPAALMLMFDDNLQSQQTNAVPELEKRKFKATFYLNPANRGFMQSPFWQTDLPKLGHEYACHTMTHKIPNGEVADREIKESAGILRRINRPSASSPLMSFARPGGKGAFEVSREQEEEILKKHQLVSRDQGVFIYLGQPLAAMESWLEGNLKKGTDARIVFHGVGGDYLPVTMDVFVPFLDAVAARQDKLWIAGHIKVHKYATAFATAKAEIKKSDDKFIVISLTTEADPALYDEPLSLRAKVPAAWKTCRVSQGARRSGATLKDGYAFFDALPGASPILLEGN